MKKSLNVIFAGTPDFARAHLSALIESNHNVIAVLTQPDRPAGRGKKLTESPVKQLANLHHLPVFQPSSLKKNEEIEKTLKNLNADLMIVVAYGLILPKNILYLPKFGCINVHGSLLPRWRGAAPIQRACWAGDKETGVTIMQMDEGMDTGDMLLKVPCKIEKNDTSGTLFEKLTKIAPIALLKTLELLTEGKLTPEKQNNNLATHAKKLTKEEANLDWNLPAIQLERNIRAFNPWPMSFFMMNHSPIKVIEANVIEQNSNEKPGTILSISKDGIQISTKEGILNLIKIQLSGKNPMKIHDFLNGQKSVFSVGNLLS